MKLTGAEIIVKFLESYEINYVAGIPGGTILPLYDALSRSKNVKHVLVRHEQAGGFIAQGIARSTGKIGVCLATSGPGVTNLLTAIADAKLDSIPIIAITGQVPYSLMGTDAFQEVDTYGITLPITKHNFIVRDVKQLLEVIPEAFRIAMDGRCGPVVVDVPKNVQMEEIEVESSYFNLKEHRHKEYSYPKDAYLEIANKINQSKRPILYIGGGIIAAEACEELLRLAQNNNIPVTTTLMGIGAFPSDDFLHLGMLGMHGQYTTNIIMNEADLIIGLGVRFDDRATGKVDEFCPNAQFIHLDIDEAEINKIKDVKSSLIEDLKEVLISLIPLVKENERKDWLSYINETRLKYTPNFQYDVFHPINIIKTVSEIIGEETIVTTDVGQHQMWVAQTYPFKRPRSLLTSGGLGTMGFGLPSAIGASLVNPNKKVVAFVGDGSICMNLQELATLSELQLDVAVIILNNGSLGMVRQQQELIYDANYFASKFIGKIDFVTVGKGFGIFSQEISDKATFKEELKEILMKKGPCLINIPIDEHLNVYPMVLPGDANIEMIGGR